MQPFITTLFNIYLAVMCGLLLIASVTLAGSGLVGVVDLLLPVPTPPAVDIMTVDATGNPVASPQLTSEASQKSAEFIRYHTIRGMLHASVYFFACAFLFALHWRIFRRRVALAELLAPKPAAALIPEVKVVKVKKAK